jgi:peptide/nickel transport system substrate-binding protein
MQKANPTAVVYSYVNAGATNLYMNVRRPPLNDVRVRRAISLAMDREEMARAINGGTGAYAMSGVFPGLFTEAEMKQLLPFNPEEAKKLLAEAGYGAGLEMDYFYPGRAFGEASIAEMQLLQAQLKKVGISLNLRSFDLNEYLSRTRGDTFQLTLRGSNPGLDIDAYLYGSFHPSSGRNYNGVDDPKLTAMIEAQRREADPAKRRAIQKQAAAYIAEMAWGLTSRASVNYQMWQPYVKDYRPNYSRYLLPATNTWLDK